MTWTQIYIVAGLVYTCIAMSRSGFDSELRDEVRKSGFSDRMGFFCATVAGGFVVVTWPYGLGKFIYKVFKRGPD